MHNFQHNFHSVGGAYRVLHPPTSVNLVPMQFECIVCHDMVPILCTHHLVTISKHGDFILNLKQRGFNWGSWYGGSSCIV